MPETTTMQKLLSVSAATALCVLISAGGAAAQGASPPDLSGSYRCQPNSDPCRWSGQTPAISQSGKTIEIKNDKGEIANAALTSDITISAGAPFNSLGIIRPDHSIDWSNGTRWLKQ